MVYQNTIQLADHVHGAYDISDTIIKIILDSGISTGICNLFIHSSNSSLIIRNISDELTKNSTVDFMAKLAPSGTDATDKIETVMDNMPPELLPVITQSTLTFPVSNKRPAIGIWQGLYYWEHSTKPVRRKLTITITGE